MLRLSSSSSDEFEKNKEEKKASKVSFVEPMPPPSSPPPPPTRTVLPKRRSRLSVVGANKSSTKKRVSVCVSELFSDEVLSIDDTILDEYENERDHKSGKIFTLHESSIEKDFGASRRVLSSTEQRIVEENEDRESENSSDELEKCILFYFF